MSGSAFYEDNSKLLTPAAFEFVLESELKRAVRSQNFLTLVILEANREWEGITVTADDGTLLEVAQLVGREVRDTDVLGRTAARSRSSCSMPTTKTRRTSSTASSPASRTTSSRRRFASPSAPPAIRLTPSTSNR